MPAHDLKLPLVTQQTLASKDELKDLPRRFPWTLTLVLFLFLSEVALLVAQSALEAGRLIAQLMILLGAVAVIWIEWRFNREMRVARALRLWKKIDREGSEAYERAVNLYEKILDGSRDGSLELSSYHLESCLKAFPAQAVLDKARRTAQLQSRAVGVLAALITMVWLGLGTSRLGCGLGVVLSRGGISPISVSLFDELEFSARAPAYLKIPEASLESNFSHQLPEGTHLNFRGVPDVDPRDLVLSDGSQHIPLAKLGDGLWGAGIDLKDNLSQWVVGRLIRDVVVPDPRMVGIFLIADEAPEVILRGAPKSYQLEQLDGHEFSFLVRDDHRIAQIRIVVESGQKLQQRSVTLPGDLKDFVDSFQLSLSDPLIRASKLPVAVWVEARDEHPSGENRWVSSEVIQFQPAPLAGSVATILRELQSSFDRAFASTTEKEALSRQKIEELLLELETIVEALAIAEESPMLGMMSRSSFANLRKSLVKFSEKERLSAWSEFYIHHQSVIQSISHRAATRMANELAGWANWGAVSSSLFATNDPSLGSSAQYSRRTVMVMAALSRELSDLAEVGALGTDLSSTIESELQRVHTLWEAKNAQLAARGLLHLSERLKTASFNMPRPKSDSSGGGGGGSGEQESSADQLARLMQELEELRIDQQVLSSETASLSQSLQKDEIDAKNHVWLNQFKGLLERLIAEKSRNNGSPSDEILLNRAEAMRDALQKGDLKQSRKSLEALAETLGSKQDSTELEQQVKQEIKILREELSSEQEGTQELSPDGRRELGRQADSQEVLAERAHQIAREVSQLSHPGVTEVLQRLNPASEAMDQATAALRERSLAPARAEQERAVEMLTPPEAKQKKPEPDDSEDGGGEDAKGEAEGSVPERSEGEKARAFRQRVQKGMSQNSSPALKEALRRYTEGLLR